MSTERATVRAEIVETLEGVEALAPEWTALEQATPEATGFQSHRWCRAWLMAARERNISCRPRVLCIRENARLVMLWPLQIETLFGVAIARWIGEPMTQYGDALAAPHEGRAQWRRVADEELARWRDVDLLAFTRLRADGTLAGCGEAAPGVGENLAAPFVDLRAAGRRRPKSMERRGRRLAAMGPTALVEAQAPAEREGVARRAYALKREWLGRKGLVSAGLSHPLAEDFLASLARDGLLRVHSLHVGADVAAIELGFVAGGAYRSLLGCYDARYAEGSPGQALTGALIARCAEEGLAIYDLLLPADPYKLTWASGATPVQAQFVARTVKGRVAAFALARLRPLAKRGLHALARFRAWLGTRKFSFGSASLSLAASTRKERPS